MNGKTILVWFRNDLRIHDNEILLEAVKKADRIVPVYCFDPAHFGMSSFDTQKTGAIRAKFIIESVADLKQSLQKLGGDLIVKFGHPQEILPEIARQYAVTEVYHHREVALEETETSSLVEAALWKLQINLKHFIGHTMYHKEDLPFPIKNIPDVFGVFRKKIERESIVRNCLDTPESISVPENMDTGRLLTLADLGLEEPIIQAFRGGETEGLRNISSYFLKPGLHRTKLSPWIALGCLSTRKLYWETRKQENSIPKETLNGIMLELLRRDYFRFMLKKHNNKFNKSPANEDEKKVVDMLFTSWKEAKTGIPIIDATLNELNSTGYINHQGRQNVATFLIHSLQINWEYGAAFFKEKLIDYSAASNLGNWYYLLNEISGNASEKNIDFLKKAQECDPKGDYVRKWIPSLASIPGVLIHQPWKLSPTELKQYGIGDVSIYAALSIA